MAVDPSDSKTIFVGNFIPNQIGSLFFTHDGGLTWSQSKFSGVFSNAVALAIDPANRMDVVMAGPAAAYASTDGGVSFAPASTGISLASINLGNAIQTLAFSPWYPGLIAAATPAGPYLSSDAGSHWTKIRGNAVPEFFSQATWSDGYLYASTFGEGVLRMPLPAPIQVSPSSVTVDSAGATASLSITVPDGSLPWTAASTVQWISITTPASGSGNATISYSVTPNTSGQARMGAITIGAYTFYISQAPSPPTIQSVVNVHYSPTIAPGSWITIFGSNLAAAGAD